MSWGNMQCTLTLSFLAEEKKEREFSTAVDFMHIALHDIEIVGTLILIP